MDDVNRKKLDEEIGRLHDKLKKLEPDSENYEKIRKQLSELTGLANADDESRNRYDIERDKLDSEASIEAAKRGMETEKLQLERDIALENAKQKEEECRQREKESKQAWHSVVITAAASIATSVGTWIFNRISQNRSEYFEATGNAYTSRFQRWQLKDPPNPNPLIRKTMK